MFYEQVVLAKKGPLGHVWLAAHWEKKITKQQVTDTNIVETVEQIRNPRAQMALRLSGHLLLGVVRIYFRKVDYLYTDCNDALGKLKKLDFRPGTVNIDESIRNVHNVTMSETIGDFEVVLPGDISTQQLPDVEEGVFSMNLAKARDITLPGEELETIRGEGRRRATLDRLQRPEQSLPSDYDLMNPDAPPELAVPDAEELLNAPDYGAPDFGPEAGYETHELVEGLGFPEAEPELMIPELPQRVPQGAVRRGGRRGFVTDRRSELSNAVIEKTIHDPSSLLRKLRRAPLANDPLEPQADDADSLFSLPAMPGLADALVSILRQTMKPSGEVEVPQVTIETSDIEERGRRRSQAEVERGGSPFRVEPGLGDYEPLPFPDDEPLPLPQEEPMPEKEVSAEEALAEPTKTEERFRPTKNTKAMFTFLARKFEEAPASAKGSLSFSTLFSGRSAHAAAIGFFELLSLKSKNGVDLKQKEPYGDIFIKKAKEFEALKGLTTVTA